jgi:hypothetical protein
LPSGQPAKFFERMPAAVPKRAQAVLEGAVEVGLLGLRVQAMSLADLIRAKRFAGRLKEQSHLEELQRLNRLTVGAAGGATELIPAGFLV